MKRQEDQGQNPGNINIYMKGSRWQIVDEDQNGDARKGRREIPEMRGRRKS